MTDNDDIKWLYGKMKAAGVNTGDEDYFRESLKDENVRDWYYRKSQELGLAYDSKDDFDASMGIGNTGSADIQAPATSNPTPTPSQTGTGTGIWSSVRERVRQGSSGNSAQLALAGSQQGVSAENEKKPLWQMSAELGMQGRANREGVQRMESIKKGSALGNAFGGGKEPLTGKRYTESGEETNELGQWYDTQKNNQQRKAEADFGSNIEERFQEAERKLQESAERDLQRANENESALDYLVAGMQDPNVMTGPKLPEDSEETKERRAIYNALKEANKIVKAAQYSEKHNGWQEFWKSFGEKIGDWETWDMGVSSMLNNGTALRVIKKLEAANGDETKLTDSERDLLDALATQAVVEQYYHDHIGKGYKIGSGVAESVPFMAEMIINPMSGAGSATGKALGKYILKRFGVKGTMKAVMSSVKNKAWKQAGKELAGTVVRDVASEAAHLAGSAGMAATTGMANVLADSYQRQIGQVTGEIGEDGTIHYTGRQNYEEDASKAFWKAFGARTIENFSESGMGAANKAVGDVATRLIGKLFKGTSGKIVGKVFNGLNKVKRGAFGQVMRRAQWQGMVPEWLEEIEGGIANAIVVGDQTLDRDPETGVFNPENMWDTFLQVAATSMMIGGGHVASYGIGKGVEAWSNANRLRQSDKEGQTVFGVDGWDDVKQAVEGAVRGISEGKDGIGLSEEGKAAMRGLMEGRSQDEKQAIVDYFGARVKSEVSSAMIADETMTDDERELQNDYSRGYEAMMQSYDEDSEDADQRSMLAASDMAIERDQKRTALAERIGEEAVSELEQSRLGGSDIDDQLARMMDEGKIGEGDMEAVKDYMKAHAAYRGVEDFVNEAGDAVSRQARMETAPTRDEQGNVRKATMKNGKTLYIKGGEVKVQKDGTIDTEGSTKALTAYDPEEDKNVFVNVDDIESMEEKGSDEVEREIEQRGNDFKEAMLNEINGVNTLGVGKEVTAENGMRGIVVAEDADNYILQMEDGQQLPVNKQQYEQELQARRMADYEERHRPQQTMEETPEATEVPENIETPEEVPSMEATEGAPLEYTPGMQLTLRDEDGNERQAAVLTDVRFKLNYKGQYEESPNGRFIALAVEGEDGVVYKHVNDLKREVVAYREETAEEEPEASVNSEGVQEEVEEEPVSAEGSEISDNSEGSDMSEGADSADSSEGVELTMPTHKVKRKRDGKMQEEEVEDWMATTPEVAYDYLYVQAAKLGLKTETADNMVDTNLKNAEKKLKEAEKATGSVISVLQKQKAAQDEVDYWNKVKKIRSQAMLQAAEEEAERTKEQRAADAARRAEIREQRRNTEMAVAGRTASERYDAAEKVEGNSVSRTIADKTKIKGHYVLVEADALTPSHDPFNDWKVSNGFPTTEDGASVNDRVYENDKAAQEFTEDIAREYDGQAVSEVPVVSSEGIVYDGNGRTMAGQIAARNNTDALYIEALMENAANFGFTEEQVQSMSHPRVVMQVDEDLPYNATTFARFNKESKKKMDNTNKAVSVAKQMTNAARDAMLEIIDRYGTLDTFFASEKAADDVVDMLIDGGFITRQEAPMFKDKNDKGQMVLSSDGRNFVTNMMLGTLFDEEAIRKLGDDKALKNSLLRAVPQIAENRRLGDYALTEEINTTIDLLYEARKSGMKFDAFKRQGNLIEGLVEDRFEPAVVLLADEMSSGVDNFRDVLTLYNKSAEEEANSGGLALFEPRTKEDVKKDIVEYYKKKRNGQSDNTEAASGAAVANETRPESAETGSAVQGTQEGDGGERGDEADGDRRGAVAESREQRLQEERKQRILAEGTSYDKPFGLTPVSETMSPDEIGANVRRIVEGLKENEGSGDFEGFAYNGNYKKNAGHQVDEYLVSLSGVVPDETLRQWYESEGLKSRDDLRRLGEKLYGDNVRSQKSEGETAKPTKEQKELTKGVVEVLKETGVPTHYVTKKGQEMLDKFRDAIKAMRVFHGSGADFEQFDHSHMGEGEGAQAYGWGTYVTEVEGIGKMYAETTSRRQLSKKITAANKDLLNALWDYEHANEEDKEQAKENYEKAEEKLTKLREEDKRRFDENDYDKILYTVEIPDDNGSNYLEWDKPMSADDRMSLLVSLEKDLLENDEYYKERYKGHENDLIENLKSTFAEGDEGMFVYEHLSDLLGGNDKKASEFLRSIGYDGIKYPAEFLSGGRKDKAKNYVIFDEGDLQIKDKIRFQKAADGSYEPDMKPVFYSNAERAVEGIKQEKATAEQWLKMIEKNGGLKAGEDKWTELSEWLKSNDKKSLTKQEVLDYIRENAIEIEDVKYYNANEGVPGNYGYNLRREMFSYAQELDEEFRNRLVEEGRLKRVEEHLNEDTLEDARRFVSERLIERYGEGGDNFFTVYPEGVRRSRSDREFNDWADNVWQKKHLFTINSKQNLESDIARAKEEGESVESVLELWDKMYGMGLVEAYQKGMFTIDENGKVHTDSKLSHPINSTRLQYTTKGLDNKREIALTVPTIESWNENDQIHFGDAGEGRAVAWVRFGETTDTDGKKVLVIDEIQSKRHQEGREKGYKDIRKVKEKERRKKEYNEYRNTLKEKYPDGFLVEPIDEVTLRNNRWLWSGKEKVLSEEERRKLQELSTAYNAALGEFVDAGNSVPDAPFEKNWQELAMKRMLRYAAENGYDKVAWTKGEQQTERYSLDKKVKMRTSEWTDFSSTFGDEAKDAKLIFVETPSGDEVTQMLVDRNGKILSEVNDQYIGRSLSDVVGNDVAVKLMTEGEQNLEGEDLRIGVEGMKGFYDQILPRYMDKYGKKWGVKTGEVELPNIGDDGLTMWSVDVTPEMKASVMEGQPMFFKTEDGEVLGYTLNGEIYIDPRVATPDTPIHEYTHLWAQGLRSSNPTAWAKLTEEMKGVEDGRLWEYVRGRYPELKNEDELTEEVFAHYSGKRGRERLEADMREEMSKTHDVFEKAKVATMFHKLREILSNFWNMARDLFAGKVEGIEKLTAEDFADMVLGDLARGYNPVRARTEQSKALDKEYMEAVERGDMETAQRMVNEAAERAGYTTDEDYKMTHTAPNGRDGFSKSIDDPSGLYPDDLYSPNGARYYGDGEEWMDRTSAAIFRRVHNNPDAMVKVYRAVPKSLKETKLRNGDWVSINREYAKEHGERNINGGYKIIEDEVPAKYVYTDANSLHEQGYDDGKDYAYQNTKNNRKLLDAVTYDDNGNVIPLSKRFNKRNADVRYAKEGIMFQKGGEEIEAINNRFNEELQKQIEGTLPAGHVYSIGEPSSILQNAGIPNLPIELVASRLVDKSMQENHPYTLEEMRDLPRAIQQPLAVFRSATHIGSYVILTEIKHGNRSFVAAIETNKRVGKIVVNSVRSVHYRNGLNIVNWINEGLGEYYKENFNEEWLEPLKRELRSKPQYNSADVRTKLNDAAKIVQNSETAKNNLQEGESENDISVVTRIGEGPQVTYTPYDEALKRAKNAGYTKAQFDRHVEKVWQQRKKTAERFAEKLNLGDRVNVVLDIDELEGMNLTDRQKRAKGWYDTKTGKIYVIMDNNTGMDDVFQTILHEGVAHHGLRELFGENFDTFLDDVYAHSTEDIRREIASLSKKYNWNVRTATEEYMAKMAEKQDFEHPQYESWWRMVKDWFIRMVKKIGMGDWIGNHTITENELRFVLWRSWKNLTEPEGNWGYVRQAQDIAMQAELGVGEYADKAPYGRDWKVEKPRKEVPMAASGDVKYDELKAQVPDKFIMMKNGELYEIKGEDAKTAARLLGLPMGEDGVLRIPEDMMEKSLSKLVRSGKKVAIAEPIAENKVAEDGIMLRDGEEELEGKEEDIWKDKTIGMQERLTAAKMRAAEQNKESLATVNEALKAIGGNLLSLRKAMSLQKEYDRATVKRVSDLARVLISGGYLDDMSKGEVKRLMSAIKNSVGHKEIEGDVQKIMDIMVDNQLRRAEESLHQLEKVKATKVNAKGVEVQGMLDVRGQRMIKAFKETRLFQEKNIEEALANAQERMGSDDTAVAEAAADEYAGLQMALEYVQNITNSKAEERELRMELTEAQHEGRKMGQDQDREYEESVNEAIRNNKIERVQAYYDLFSKLQGGLRGSIAKAMEFKENEIERVRAIRHNANSDMEGRKSDEHYQPEWKDKLVNNPVSQFMFAPLATFDQMLRVFGSKSANGEGYLYNRFMRGWVDAQQKEIRGVREKFATLDEKAREVFRAKNWGDMIRKAGKLPKMTVGFWNGGKMQDTELSQGNLMYIYMVDKMDDGRMKLRKMGIDTEAVKKITEKLDPRLKEIADWLQNEFLVETRNEYNETHKRMFGAPMAAVENYFPLKILANARVDTAENLDNPITNEGISTSTGSIIKRRRNALALDITGADALNVILDHVAQMEHWNAFAEYNRDLNTLRTYKHFRNQVKNMRTIYGSGDTLWKKFNNVAQMAAGTYRPPRSEFDEAALNFAKGVTAAKVSFRVFTAMKQFLSFPAYFSEARPDLLAKNLATPWMAWKWGMENLPIFEERWKSKMIGDPRLQKSDMDWKAWRNNVVQMASKIGMSPNAFVDAMTISIGAHAIYQTKKAQYLKEGFDEATAEKKAVQDAEVLYNQTQQSSEGAFTSTMQVDRSWLSVMFTVFRNSSMSYQRQLHDALRNMKRNLSPKHRKESIEFMTKQLEREGLTTEQAKIVAKKRYGKQIRKDAVRIAIFGYILQLAWNLGGYLPYLLFGDDDDKKKEMWKDMWTHTMFGWLEGLTGGDILSQAGGMLLSGEGNPEYLSKEMPLTSDMANTLKKVGSGKYYEAVTDIANLIVQMGIGVNPQSITDAALAIMDACGDNPELAREATVAVMRVLQVPQSQIKQIYFDELGLTGDEASKYTPAQLAERYARYQVKRGRFFTPWAWDDEEAIAKARTSGDKIAKARTSGDKIVKERMETMGDAAVNEAYEEYSKLMQPMAEKVKEANRLTREDPIEGAQAWANIREKHLDRYMQYNDWKEMDKKLDEIVKMYLGSETAEEASKYKQAIEEYKQAMMEAMSSTDTEKATIAKLKALELYNGLAGSN